MPYEGPERRACSVAECPLLDDAKLDDIAERAAERAFDKMYQAVGKGLLNRLAWLAGAAVIGLIYWLAKNGIEVK